MKVLFVCLYPFFANNSGMMRNRALINGLIQNGHTVDVISINNNRLQKTIDAGNCGVSHFYFAGSNKLYDAITNQTNKKRSSIKAVAEKVLRRLFHAFYPFDYTMKIAKRINISILDGKDYDLVISSSNPLSSHRAVKELSKQGLHYKSWIQYWGDPLSYNISNTTILPDFFLRTLENKLFSKSNRIVFVSPLTLDYEAKYHSRYRNKMSWLPIPYLEEKHYHGGKYISYFGDYIKKTRNIVPFFEAANELKTPTIIAGTSDLKLESTEYVRILDRGDISDYMDNTAVLVVILNRYGTQIPGKIYHFAGTNIKCLIVCDGSNSDSIKKHFEMFGERFVFCDNKKDDIVSALRLMLRDQKPVFPISNYSCKAVAKQMIDMLASDIKY